MLFSHETKTAIGLVQKAMQVILEVYQQDFEVSYKEASEPVTLADKLANSLIVQGLDEAFPGDGIIGEESIPSDETSRLTILARDRVWFVDPLDGTKEFIAKNGEFACMVGLCVGGVPKVGVVGLPTGEILVGEEGVGAWCLDAHAQQLPLTVSACEQLQCARVIVSRSHTSRSLSRALAQLPETTRLECGSVGMKVGRIVQQKAEIYLNVQRDRGSKLWDACAPEALLRAAGGTVTTTEGLPIDYQFPSLVLRRGMVGTNGKLHDAVISRINGSRADGVGPSPTPTRS